MKFAKYGLLSICFLLFAAGLSFAKTDKKPKKALSFPGLADSLQTLDRGVDAVTVVRDRVFTFSDGVRHIAVTPLKRGKAASREARFGKITDSKRHPTYEKEKDTPTVRGAVLKGKRLLVMDATQLSLVSVFADDMQETIRRTIPLDLLKPPRDRGGEAPSFEIKEYRSKFKKQFVQSKTLPFVGLASVPAAWQGGGNELLVLSRLADFPFLILKCNEEDPSQCSAVRGCFASYVKGVDRSNLRGLSAYEPKRWLLVGDPEAKLIRVLKYSSCYQIREIGQIHLPEKLKTLTNLWVDEENQLWISTNEPDWFHNASVYMWSEKAWTELLD